MSHQFSDFPSSEDDLIDRVRVATSFVVEGGVRLYRFLAWTSLSHPGSVHFALYERSFSSVVQHGVCAPPEEFDDPWKAEMLIALTAPVGDADVEVLKRLSIRQVDWRMDSEAESIQLTAYAIQDGLAGWKPTDPHPRNSALPLWLVEEFQDDGFRWEEFTSLDFGPRWTPED